MVLALVLDKQITSHSSHIHLFVSSMINQIAQAESMVHQQQAIN
jgi:hypothetical protein